MSLKHSLVRYKPADLSPQIPLMAVRNRRKQTGNLELSSEIPV
jgi:hypothetical protein